MIRILAFCFLLSAPAYAQQLDTVDGVDIWSFKERGAEGDGGIVIHYAIDEKDGTFVGISEWYEDAATADTVYKNSSLTFKRWIIYQARRLAQEPSRRPPIADRPIPTE